MPRLPRSLLRAAYAQNPLLPTLLQECRTLEQGTSELRWLREYLDLSHPSKRNGTLLKHLCSRRGRGEPLQYILGTQPFGALEILCRKGVLIPRPETEHLTSHLFSHLSRNADPLPSPPLRILDLCTGTGCISLHVYSLLSDAGIRARCVGIDVSRVALNLASANLRYNIKNGALAKTAETDVEFVYGDILSPGFGEGMEPVDVVVSNPPYISDRGFEVETGRSVRRYEPKLALVPPRGEGDVFYPVVERVARRLGAKVVVVEVGGWEQAERVKEAWQEESGWEGVNVWPDYVGKGRGVVAWKKGWEWVKDGPLTG